MMKKDIMSRWTYRASGNKPQPVLATEDINIRDGEYHDRDRVPDKKGEETLE